MECKCIQGGAQNNPQSEVGIKNTHNENCVQFLVYWGLFYAPFSGGYFTPHPVIVRCDHKAMSKMFKQMKLLVHSNVAITLFKHGNTIFSTGDTIFLRYISITIFVFFSLINL